MYQRILIAVEGNESDQAVLDHVQRLAQVGGCNVTVLRVITVADDGGEGLGKQFQLELGSSGWRRKKEAQAYLSAIEAQLRQAGLSVETRLLVGTRSEGDEIVSYAAENGHDLIAMASDTRPWYKRLLRTAQDDDVMRKATVPTLFIGDGRRKVPAPRAAPQMNTAMAILGHADL